MKKKTKIVTSAVAVSMCVVMSAGLLTGCGGGTTALVIMTEELNGLFNPFYSTSGTDMDVVGMTQIGMLTTDSNGKITCGEDEATVVLDYEVGELDTVSNTTTYTFVIKNGITFSDGVPLTMNDILFNMYVYLDPAYTGSSTMYSTDIVGLTAYRMQTNVSDSSGEEDKLAATANLYAKNRIYELQNVFYTAGRTNTAGSYDADETKMTNYIATYTPSSGYKTAIGEQDTEKSRAQLLEDYKYALEKFEAELKNDYASAKDSYTDEPYSKVKDTANDSVGFDEITSFMYAEGFVTLEYAQQEGSTADKNTIVKVNRNYPTNTVTSEEAAIKYVYDAVISSKFDQILDYWGTGQELLTEFSAKARDIILHENLKDDELAYPSITGIVSLGHANSASSVTINGIKGEKTYTVATSHNADGTPTSGYDVLQIKVNGVDPKAIYNFSFTVAPYHYYSDESIPVDISKNQFGVEWASFDFHKYTIQGNTKDGVSKNKVPLGAGPYIATNRNTTTGVPADDAFYDTTTNVVYYRANENFLLGAPKIEKVRYQVVSSSNAIPQLQRGTVHFITPQYTPANAATLSNLTKGGKYGQVDTWQLGYGYIGISAGKVPDINLRRAIMSAMDTSLALQYYTSDSAVNIGWPMSVVSWAYPAESGYQNAYENGVMHRDDYNGHDYATSYYLSKDQATRDEEIKTLIKKYMGSYKEGNPALKLRFTIAGSNLSEHPTYLIFKHAAELLNECGWDIEVVPDTNALVKLATGSLTVWAAAWGSTIDPDMYQVYHKNSTATSVYAWGYREILAAPGSYPEETRLLTLLSDVIDDARETNDVAERTKLYKEAMGYVLDLAVELPVYQRKTLYAYNAKVIDASTFPAEINSYSSPLGKIWEIDFV